MKRIIYIFTVVAILAVLLGGVTAFADYSPKNLTRGTVYAETFEGGTTSHLSDVSNSEGVTDDPTYATAAEDNEDAAEESGESDLPEDNAGTNPFELLFNTVKEYATEIFCLLSFVGSLILAYAYKSGLLPIVKKGIGAISYAVSGIKEAAERGELKTDELSRAVCERLAQAEDCLGGIEDAVDNLSERLAALSSEAEERQKLKVILAAQIDMLYDIFMASSIPEYQKEAVGRRVAEMRKELSADECGNKK